MNTPDLDQRLGLYRVFLKLYEHHRELLDEILDLENTDNRHRTRGVWQYVQGVLQDDSAYLTTNLLRNQTISLMQPEHIWVIGRDRRVGLAIQDKRLSRRHAMIQYVAGKGFYLVDLNSTNGSYVNSEPVRHPKLLQDGDRIRLGSLSFIFFLCRESKLLESIPAETQAQLGSTHTHSFGPLASADNPSLEQDSESLADDFRREGNNDGEKETSMFLKTPLCQKEEAIDPMAPQLSTAQKADILDRFLNR